MAGGLTVASIQRKKGRREGEEKKKRTCISCEQRARKEPSDPKIKKSLERTGIKASKRLWGLQQNVGDKLPDPPQCAQARSNNIKFLFQQH